MKQETTDETIKSRSKLWLVTNTTVGGYDTYDSCVVVADTEEEARMIYPGVWYGEKPWDGKVRKYSDWGAAKDNRVEYIGETDREFPVSVICASFNAG
jgi:hypothetical protein